LSSVNIFQLFFNKCLVSSELNEECGGRSHFISWGLRYNSDLDITSSNFRLVDHNGKGLYTVDSTKLLSCELQPHHVDELTSTRNIIVKKRQKGTHPIKLLKRIPFY